MRPPMRAPIRSLAGAFLIFGAAAALSACNNGNTPTLSLPSLPIPSAAQTVYSGTITTSGLSGNYAEVPGDSCTAHRGSVNATHE